MEASEWKRSPPARNVAVSKFSLATGINPDGAGFVAGTAATQRVKLRMSNKNKHEVKEMEFAKIIAALIVAAFLVLPVSAGVATTTTYDPVTGVTSKYVDRTETVVELGHVYGMLRSGGVLEGGERFLVQLEGSNETQVYNFAPDGKIDFFLPPGDYIVTLPMGTGSAAVYTEDAGYVGNLHSETANITVVAGQTQQFSFIGNSIPTGSEASSTTIGIISATYGKIVKIIDQAAIPAIDAVYQTIHHPAVPGTPATPATGVLVSGYTPGHVHAKYAGHSQVDFYYLGIAMHITGNSHDAAFLVTPGTPGTPGTPAYDEVILVSPAVPAVEEVSHMEGSIIDVTAQMRAAVATGAVEITFDNAKTPGGIFDLKGNLLSQIADPSVGNVKDVTIKLVVNGVTKTVNAEEYDTINLATGMVS